MAKDEFSKSRNATTGNTGGWEKRGASEKPVGPQVPMNEQKPPGVKPEVNPHTQASESHKPS